MAELTDEEILAKLAAIEGWRPLNQGRYRRSHGVMADPINDKRQAFELLEKYKIEVGPEYSCSPESPAAEFTGKWTADALYDGFRMRVASAVADTPQRAICLAIIRSQEPKGD